MADLDEIVTTENITESVNVTGKTPSSVEGMALAYGSLVIMAMIPIFFGSKKSVKHQKKVKVSSCRKREKGKGFFY